MTKHLETKHSAFSLTEALVVMLIVSIITMITIPLVTKKRTLSMNSVHGKWACTYRVDPETKQGQYLQASAVNGDHVFTESDFAPTGNEGKDNCQFPTLSKAVKYLYVEIFGAGGGGSVAQATPWVDINHNMGFGDGTNNESNIKNIAIRDGDYDIKFAIRTDGLGSYSQAKSLMLSDHYLTGCNPNGSCSGFYDQNYYHSTLDDSEMGNAIKAQCENTTYANPYGGNTYYRYFMSFSDRYNDNSTKPGYVDYAVCEKYDFVYTENDKYPYDIPGNGDYVLGECVNAEFGASDKRTKKPCISDFTSSIPEDQYPKDGTGKKNGYPSGYVCYRSSSSGIMWAATNYQLNFDNVFWTIEDANNALKGKFLNLCNSERGNEYHYDCRYTPSTDDQGNEQIGKVERTKTTRTCVAGASLNQIAYTHFLDDGNGLLTFSGKLFLKKGQQLIYTRETGRTFDGGKVGNNSFVYLGGKAADSLVFYIREFTKDGSHNDIEIARIDGNRNIATYQDTCPYGEGSSKCELMDFTNIDGYMDITSTPTRGKFYLVQPEENPITWNVQSNLCLPDQNDRYNGCLQAVKNGSADSDHIGLDNNNIATIEGQRFDFHYGCPGETPQNTAAAYIAANRAGVYHWSIGLGGEGAKFSQDDLDVVENTPTAGGLTYFENVSVAGGAAGGAANGTCRVPENQNVVFDGASQVLQGPESLTSTLTLFNKELSKGGRGGGMVYMDQNPHAINFEPVRDYNLAQNQDTDPSNRWRRLDGGDGTAGMIIVSW